MKNLVFLCVLFSLRASATVLAPAAVSPLFTQYVQCMNQAPTMLENTFAQAKFEPTFSIEGQAVQKEQHEMVDDTINLIRSAGLAPIAQLKNVRKLLNRNQKIPHAMLLDWLDYQSEFKNQISDTHTDIQKVDAQEESEFHLYNYSDLLMIKTPDCDAEFNTLWNALKEAHLVQY
jgi:hypothetical protein